MDFQHGKTKFDKKYYKRFFNKYSKSEFDKYVNWAYGWIRFLDPYMNIREGKGKTLLELGSSLGYFSRIFKDRGFEVVGSDISDFIVKKARRLQKDIKFIKLDIEKETKLDKKFDYIIAFEVFEHLKNPQKTISNIFLNLNQNGTLLLSTPFPTKRSLSDPTHINVHREKWWLDAGKKAGFKKRKVVYGTFVPLFYRINKVFSWGFSIKTDIPLVNSTVFYIFKK